MDPDTPIIFLTPPQRSISPDPPNADMWDPMAIAVLAAIAAGLLLYRLLAGARRGRRALSVAVKRSCRWHRTTVRRGRTMSCYACATCGAEAYSQDRRPPKECKRTLRPASL